MGRQALVQATCRMYLLSVFNQCSRNGIQCKLRLALRCKL
ncbi:extensin [Iris pallida]|uniref:Extensin n=1 Tax=Iris pallida TaxID=29817 RepID=A0AAX6F8S7_IRIPA|nr:extensin [Iris pallida]